MVTDDRLTNVLNLTTNYLNNILNINILLVSIGLVLVYWIFNKSNKSWWDCTVYGSIILGVIAIIINLTIYRDLIVEMSLTGLNPNKPYVPNTLKCLSMLDTIFYIDLFAIGLLALRFFRKIWK